MFTSNRKTLHAPVYRTSVVCLTDRYDLTSCMRPSPLTRWLFTKSLMNSVGLWRDDCRYIFDSRIYTLIWCHLWPAADGSLFFGLQPLFACVFALQAVDQMQESLQQQVEQVSLLLEHQHNLPSSLIHQATQLQVNNQAHNCVDMSTYSLNLDILGLLNVQSELDGALGDVRTRSDKMRKTVELQRLYERLVRSLEELLALGSERLALQPEVELHDRAQLQQQHCSLTVSLWDVNTSLSGKRNEYKLKNIICSCVAEILSVPGSPFRDPAVPDRETPWGWPPKVEGCSDGVAGRGGPTATARIRERNQDAGSNTGRVWNNVQKERREAITPPHAFRLRWWMW